MMERYLAFFAMVVGGVLPLLTASAQPNPLELGCVDLYAETTFPAFNQKVAGEWGRQTMLCTWRKALPAMRVHRGRKARYAGLMRVPLVECWQMDGRTAADKVFLAKVHLLLFVYDVEKQSPVVLLETFFGYAHGNLAQAEPLQLVCDAFQASMTSAAAFTAKKLTGHTSRVKLTSKEEYLAKYFPKQSKHQVILPNPLRTIKLAVTPSVRKVYLGTNPPVYSLEASGIDMYGDGICLEPGKIIWSVHDGTKETKLAQARFTPRQPGKFTLRARYLINGTETLESAPVRFNVLSLAELSLPASPIILAPEETTTIKVTGKGLLGEELTSADLEGEVELLLTPSSLASVEGLKVKAGKQPGTAKLTVLAKSNRISATGVLYVEKPEKIDIHLVPEQGPYVLGKPVAIRLEKMVLGKKAETRWSLYIHNQKEPQETPIPGLYDWMPSRPGKTLLVGSEPDSGLKCETTVTVVEETKAWPPQSVRTKLSWFNKMQCLLGKPANPIPVEAALNQERFAREEEIKIGFTAQQPGCAYLLYAIPEGVQMIFPTVGYIEPPHDSHNDVVAKTKYTYPYPDLPGMPFPVRLYMEQDDELYLVLVSADRILTLDRLLEKASAEAKAKEARGQEVDCTIPLSLRDLQSVGEELLGRAWGYATLHARQQR